MKPVGTTYQNKSSLKKFAQPLNNIEN